MTINNNLNLQWHPAHYALEEEGQRSSRAAKGFLAAAEPGTGCRGIAGQRLDGVVRELKLSNAEV